MTVETESSTPTRYLPATRDNMTDDLMRNAARAPDRPAVARWVAGEWRTVTWRRFREDAVALAAALVGAGIRPGDRVAVMAGTSAEWVRADYAIWLAAAVTVPIYDTAAPTQVEWILRDSGAVAAFAGNDRQRATLAAVASGVRRTWPMAELDALAATATAADAEEVTRRRAGLGPDLPATIVYTSGTTGRPKGCLLTHGNLLAEVHAVTMADGIDEQVLGWESSVLLFLPLAHVLTRVVQLAAVHSGALTAHLDDPARLGEALATFRPTVLLAVPRVFEKFHDRVARTAASAGHGTLFRIAERTAVAYSRALDSGRVPLALRVRHRLLDRLVLRRIREALGGRVTHAVSGGAPLAPRLAHFLRGLGLVVLEGYGLTETTAGVTLNLPGAQRIGTVGRPLPGCRVRLAEDGEVLVKGAIACSGYWRDEAASAALFDADGWLRTGDLGSLADGYLTIVGRKKDIIVTAGGKNVAPEPLEELVREHPLVDQCVLVGDRRPFVAALVTIDREALATWRPDGPPPTDAELEAEVATAVEVANHTVSTAESIRRFRIVPVEFTVGDELTPTQKLRRERVFAKYAADIEALYAA
jgi:long-chain acyl-CoA synthetase